MSEGLWSSSDRRVENAIDWARHLYQLEIGGARPLVELDLWGSFAKISGRPFSERIQKPMSSWVLASTGGSEMQSGTSF